MDTTLKKMIQLLDSGNLETKRAAIRVLTDLNLRDKELIKKFGEKLHKDSDQLIRALLLEYAIKNPCREFLPHLVDSLLGFGSNREKIISALAAYGDSAVPGLIQSYQIANDAQQKSLLTVLTEIATSKANQFVLDSMKRNRSLDHLKFVCYLIKSSLERMDKPSKTSLHKCLLAFYKENKKDRMLATSSLILFGYLKDPADKKYLIEAILQAKGDFHQRKHALNALVNLNLGGKGHDDLIQATLPQLTDPDFPNIVRNAILILEKLEFSKKYQKELQQLLNSQHPSVRSFSLQKLSAFDSSENVEMLIKHLDSNDFRVKQAAQSSLEKSPKAVPKLLKMFEAAANFEQAERLVQILKSHREQFRPPLLRRYYLKMEQLLRKSNESFRYYLLLIRSVNPEFLYVNVMKRYKLLKSKKKWLEASNCLNMLENVVAQNHELRLESAMCKVMLEKIDYSIVSRDRHQGLLTLQGIAKSRPPQELAKQLLSDKKIPEEQKYFIGFHFAEKQQNLREFGTLILKALSRKSGKFGKLAKKKLEAAKQEPQLVSQFS